MRPIEKAQGSDGGAWEILEAWYRVLMEEDRAKGVGMQDSFDVALCHQARSGRGLRPGDEGEDDEG